MNYYLWNTQIFLSFATEAEQIMLTFQNPFTGYKYLQNYTNKND